MPAPPPDPADDTPTPDPSAAKGLSLLLGDAGDEQVGPRGVAALGDLFQLPVIELRMEAIQAEATESIPLHILTRIQAFPYRIDDGRLKVAVADPSNVQHTDELRMVSPYPIDLGVATAA